MNRYIPLTILLFFLASCATQKSHTEQSKVGKLYHDVTAKFNGYFNADILLAESMATLEAQHVDNYNQMLPLYKYIEAENAQAVANDLDEAIKKVSVVVTLHEYSQWADDCYLLIGKAFYLKQDYESAEDALEYFLDEFQADGSRIASTKKRKKSDREKKKTGPSSKKKKSQKDKEAEQARKEYNRQLKKKKKNQKKKSNSKKKKPSKPEPLEKNPSPKSTKKAADKSENKVLTEEERKEAEAADAENPGNLKHRPAYQEAMLWLARTYIERDNHPTADYYLSQLVNNPNLQDEVKRELPVVQAYFAIRKSQYERAVSYLDRAVEMARKKREKARYAYIKAQLEDMSQNGSPYESFKTVLDYNPAYEMGFNARLNMAKHAMRSGVATQESIVKTLEKMLKDEKNDEYKDQIYYTLAQIDLENRDVDAAIANLLLAVENAGANKSQQTETHYLLATLYFDKPDYVNAKTHYDAALSTMSKEDERYLRTERLANNLTDIAKHLQTIELQDSLLRISEMSEDEQRALAKKLKKQQEEELAKKELASSEGATLSKTDAKNRNQSGFAMRSGGNTATRNSIGAASLASTFFAYDEKAVKRGKREFARTWGNRSRVDFWRLSSRAAPAADAPVVATGLDEYEEPLELEDFLKGIPSTEEEKTAAHDQIANAMLELGKLYREKLETFHESAEILEDLLVRYPGSKYQLDAYYQLYLSYLELGEMAKAEKYKQKIIDEYGESKYALALSDPNYLKNQLTEEQKLERYYNDLYADFEAEQFIQAKEKVDRGNEKFGTGHAFAGRFALVRAMSIGNIEGRDPYVKALKEVIARYPNSPEETKARDMLLLLGAYSGTRPGIRGDDGSGARFKIQPDILHFVLVMVHNQDEVTSRDAKISITTYNRTYHKLDKLKISSLIFDPKTKQSLILIRSFDNMDQAMAYHSKASVAEDFLPPNADFELMAVTQHNYREIIKQKSVDDYRTFFEVNYQD